MKKTISAIFVITLLLALVGCGATEPKTATLIYSETDTGITYRYHLEAIGDKCQKLTQTTCLDCSMYDADQMAYLEAAIAEYAGIYAAYEGVSYTTDITDSQITEVLTIDVSDMTLVKSLSSAGLLPMDNGSADYISLQKTVESLESQGWTVVE